MSSAMDLDASLDDIIKKKRPIQQKKGSSKQQQHNNKPNNKFQQKNITKSTQNIGRQQSQQQKQVGKKTGGILGRLGPSGIQRQSKVNMKQPQRLQLTTAALRSKSRNGTLPKALDKPSKTSTLSTSSATTPNASNIVITKHVSGRLDYDGQQQQYSSVYERYQPSQQPTMIQQQPIRQETNFAIRGLSAPSPGISIRGESGPASVLISNLDREANSDDVRTACSQFGDVIGCEVFYDRRGRSVGEAEVEFASKASALDCIAKLDNESADGQILRVILRERPTNKYVKPQETRPIMASAINYPTGKMYADHIETSRYGVPTRRY
ncbi:hypothetical protein BC941DRAFT_370878 [Chlamydoabsidia padenii]|nr:hypothetical protein BC941DRAFT_370878 [Chlamydoabsidia padenii]